ncbi:MAG: hypothetical protein OJJ54_03490 [Pseudonocardia sp.]|nr:hypothetical protein [Pseudonocardia sp.]
MTEPSTAPSTGPTGAREPGAHFVPYDKTAQPSSWVGWIWFAAVIMVMLGLFNLVYGFSAVYRNQVFAEVPSGVLVLDLTSWGWVHIALGVLQLVVGGGLMTGRRWALVLGVVLAVLNAVGQLIALPYHPFWALIIVAVDCLVIYAMVVHGGELRRAARRR